jgi:type 1 glutamine amidotransferase
MLIPHPGHPSILARFDATEGAGYRCRMRRALVVRGGWEGHVPVEATDLFIPALSERGFAIDISESLSVYADPHALSAYDLIVQCWSIGTITDAESAGLRAAVRAGVGFAGWHGGVLATFAGDVSYQRMVGGVFTFHRPEFVDYRVRPTAAGREHPVTRDIGDFDVHSEQYWLLTDAYSEVLATTVYQPYPDSEFGEPVEMPVVWTRSWGSGRVFVSAIGHRLADLTAPEVFQLTLRGLEWAARIG